jgi:flagellar FliL protein
MADEATPEEGKKGKKGKKADKEGKEGKGKSNLVPAVVLAVGLVLGGKMMGGGGGAAAAPTEPVPAAEHAAEDPEHVDCAVFDIKNEPQEGGVYNLEPLSINLADGHYLKVGVALQLSVAEDLKHFTEEGLGAKAADIVIKVFGGRSMEELSSAAAVEEVKEQLAQEIRPLYHCEVLDVLLTNFVMQ